MKSLSKVLFVCLIVAMSFGCLSQKDKDESELKSLSTAEKMKETKSSTDIVLKVISKTRTMATLQWTIPNTKEYNMGAILYLDNYYSSASSNMRYLLSSSSSIGTHTATIALLRNDIYSLAIVAKKDPWTTIGVSNTITIDNR